MNGAHRPAVLVEAFSDQPFAGNGAAVVHLEQAMPLAWLQSVATSLRQSETAFVLRASEGWMLRWCTPTCEVPLCGHATLAALLALGHWGLVEPGDSLVFHSRSGPLEASLPSGSAGSGAIVLPSAPLQPSRSDGALDAWLRECLGCGLEACWTSDLYDVVLLPAEAPLAAATLPAEALQGHWRRGLVLMQQVRRGEGVQLAGSEADYQLRFLAPDLGIPEDPVTGSAHALVAPWWMERLGRTRLRGWQCSDRPGGMGCEVLPSGMIRLIGSGHLLWDGALHTGSRRSAPDPANGSHDSVDRCDAAWAEWRAATHLPCCTPSDAIPS